MPERKEGVVPRLRFPEFRNAGEWKVKRLVDIADVNAAGDLDSKEFSPVRTQDHIYPVYSNSVAQEGLYGFCSYPKYKKESVTITARGTLGVAFYRDHDFVGIGRLLIVSNLHETSPRFLKELWNHLVREPFEDGGIPQLTAIKARRVKLFLPNLSEQQKIADCLSSLDEVIELQAQELEALKAHKKGLMQQLFPREGETTPRLRFPEFRDAGPWEVKRLGEICSAFSGGTPSSSIKEYYGGSIPFIRSAEINQDTTELFLTEEGLKNSSAKLVVKGDILIALYGANSGDGALSKIDGAINQAILCLRSKLNHSFILAYWRLRKNEIVMRFIQGGQGNLSAEIVKSIAFAFPSLAEQQKIADCFSSLDRVIELEAQKLEAFKTHKKGLMQQLFPQEVD